MCLLISVLPTVFLDSVHLLLLLAYTSIYKVINLIIFNVVGVILCDWEVTGEVV